MDYEPAPLLSCVRSAPSAPTGTGARFQLCTCNVLISTEVCNSSPEPVYRQDEVGERAGGTRADEAGEAAQQAAAEAVLTDVHHALMRLDADL